MNFNKLFQASQIVDCELQRQFDLPFRFQRGSCNTFAIPDEKGLLCFSSIPSDRKSCHLLVKQIPPYKNYSLISALMERISKMLHHQNVNTITLLDWPIIVARRWPLDHMEIQIALFEQSFMILRRNNGPMLLIIRLQSELSIKFQNNCWFQIN